MSDQDAVERSTQYLSSAEVLLDRGDPASAISRAYYAMFFLARALLKRRNVEPRTHSGMVGQFGLKLVKSGPIEEEFGRAFREAQQLREFAEYAELPNPVSKEDARTTIDSARSFVERMRKELAT